MKRITCILLIVMITNICKAQIVVTDDFNDNDLSLWSGNVGHFIVNSNHQLQLNNNVAATSYISTTFAPGSSSQEWELYVRQSFAGSGNNYGRIYLMSSQGNLSQPTQGYYLQLGEAGNNDAVELFRQTGTVSISVCRAANAGIASAFAIRIKVTRDDNGVWKLLIDYAGGTEFIEAATGTDATYSSGQFMGMLCVYTAGNATRFFYDDIYAGVPRVPPPPADVADKFDLVINEFFVDPSPSVGLGEDEFVEIYNRSAKKFDLDNWKIGDATSLVSLPAVTIHPDEYVMVRPPSLNNAGDVIKLVSPEGLVIDSITYSLDWYQDESKSSGGYSIERLNPEMPSVDATNWYVSQHEVGGTPGVRNSVFGRNPDSKAPVIVSVDRVNDSTFVVRFSEHVLLNAENYKLEGVGKISIEPAADLVVLKLSGLINGTSNALIINNIQDIAGNLAESKTVPFRYFIPHPVHRKDVIITEIMADPSPPVQLPEGEYIEVFNRSVHPISLSGWHLEDANAKASLPDIIIMPNAYATLTSISNGPKFNAIAVSGFPSLSNVGEVLILRNSDSQVIDSMAYNLSWYHNTEKSDGGWSIELIDINNPCGEGDNWTSSEDLAGGTPGKLNSVFASKPDITPPVLLNLFPVSKDTLLLMFNEKLGTKGNLSLPGIASYKDLSKREIYYKLSESLALRTQYQITITDVEDCNGNVMSPMTLSVVLPEPALPNDIVINEVLFNPRPNGADFVEIYNRSEKYINLKGWTLSDELIAADNNILPPFSYRVLTESISSVESNYPTAKEAREMSMPSMPDDEGTVILKNPDQTVIDQFAYTDSMHSSILDDAEGVSLERISPDEANWHSAASTAGFATPGFVNSSTRVSPDLESGAITVSPEVILPASFSQIHYRFDRAGLVANVSVVDLDGRVIKRIAHNETLGTEGSFQWDGDRDDGGLVRCGYYLVWFQTFDLDGRAAVWRGRIVVVL